MKYSIKKKTNIISKFGARYGCGLRKKYKVVLNFRKRIYNCCNCGKRKIKRLYNGIWQCKNCKISYSGGSYTLKLRFTKKIISS